MIGDSMQFYDFLETQDFDLSNETIVENLVASNRLSIGPLTLGQKVSDIKAWPLDWDSSYSNQIEFRSCPDNHIRNSTLEVWGDDAGIVQYVLWNVQYNVPPRDFGPPESDWGNPEIAILAAFEEGLGTPDKKSKAGTRWRSGDTSLAITHGRETNYNGVVLVGLFDKSFRNDLDPKMQALL